ncbi:MAG: hypothetical protein IPL86_13315 [Flavobacteriales bacterium]|nr:hypothetical protein [Flavobacteriales bacterium]
MAARQRSIAMRSNSNMIRTMEGGHFRRGPLQVEIPERFPALQCTEGARDRFEELVASRPDRPILVAFTPQHWSEIEGIATFDEITALFAELEARHPNLHFYDYSQHEAAGHGF